MRDEQADQLLEFIRHEVLLLLLADAVPGGMGAMIRRLKLEYPDLDLFSKAAARASRSDDRRVEDNPEILRFRDTVLARMGYPTPTSDADGPPIRVQPAPGARRPRRSFPAGDRCDTTPRTLASRGGAIGDDAADSVRDRTPGDGIEQRRSDQRGRDLSHARK